MARLFVSVRPPPAVLDAVDAWLRGVPAVRAGPRARTHLTLRFLGEVADVDAAARALGVLGARSAFTVRLGGAGAFTGLRRRSVLWLGICEGAERLAALATAVDRALDLEPSPFAAHLTLARLAHGVDVRELVRELGDGPVGPRWTVDAVLLEESSFPREPVAYRTVAATRLRGRASRAP